MNRKIPFRTSHVQHWMGHADPGTTARYLHYKSRANEAKLLADALRVEEPATVSQAVSPTAQFEENSAHLSARSKAA